MSVRLCVRMCVGWEWGFVNMSSKRWGLEVALSSRQNCVGEGCSAGKEPVQSHRGAKFQKFKVKVVGSSPWLRPKTEPAPACLQQHRLELGFTHYFPLIASETGGCQPGRARDHIGEPSVQGAAAGTAFLWGANSRRALWLLHSTPLVLPPLA